MKGNYKNLKDLYENSDEFKKLFDEEKGNPAADDKLENYFENDYNDDVSFVDKILSDIIPNILNSDDKPKYSFQVEKNNNWLKQKIKIKTNKYA